MPVEIRFSSCTHRIGIAEADSGRKLACPFCTPAELERLQRELAEARERKGRQTQHTEYWLARYHEMQAARVADRARLMRAEADREQLRAATIEECAKVCENRAAKQFHSSDRDAMLRYRQDQRTALLLAAQIRALAAHKEEKPNVDARAFDQAHGLRDDPITGGIADRPLQIDQTK